MARFDVGDLYVLVEVNEDGDHTALEGMCVYTSYDAACSAHEVLLQDGPKRAASVWVLELYEIIERGL